MLNTESAKKDDAPEGAYERTVELAAKLFGREPGRTSEKLQEESHFTSSPVTASTGPQMNNPAAFLALPALAVATMFRDPKAKAELRDALFSVTT